MKREADYHCSENIIGSKGRTWCVTPPVSPEKYASVIWQKNVLPATSVEGRLTPADPQMPLSARKRARAAVKLIISAMIKLARNLRRLVFITFLFIRITPSELCDG
jgi:hypothetical protein